MAVRLVPRMVQDVEWIEDSFWKRRHDHLKKQWGTSYDQKRMKTLTYGIVSLFITMILSTYYLFTYHNYTSIILFIAVAISGSILSAMYLVPLGGISNL